MTKKYKSIIDVPVRVEVVDPKSERVVTPEDLQEQLEAARKGRAKVDSKYVGNAEGLNHLFEYKYDYQRFLENMSHIIKEGKRRQAENPSDRYNNPHEMIIQ